MIIMNGRRYFFYDKPDDGGSGGSSLPTGNSGKTLEQLTVEKLSGKSEPAPEPKPEPKPADDGGQDPDPDPEPTPEPRPEPKKPAGSDDGAGDGEPSRSEGSTGDDSGFYYDPSVHVKGEPAHQNKFKTREQAEYAAINKADMLREKIEQMREDGVSPGAVPLPSILNGDIESVERYTSLEMVTALDDDQLRAFLNESDATRQRFDKKHERVTSQKEIRKAKTDYEQKQVELYDQLEKIMDVSDIQANIDKIGNRDSGAEFITAKINDKVRAELSDMRDDLEKWIDQVDSNEIDLSVREFDKQKQARVDAIETKAKELRGQYEPAIDTFNTLFDLHERVETTQKTSPEQMAKNMYLAFDEFQNDRSGMMAILDDNPAAKSELVAAKKFAIQNKESFNNLQNPRDWVSAMEGWEDHKAKVRANRERKELQGGQPGASGSAGDDDVPKPGDQSKLRGDDKRGGVYSQNRRSLDKLVELTNAR